MLNGEVIYYMDLQIKSAILKNPSMSVAQVKTSVPGILDDVAECTIHHHLSGEFNFKSRKPAKKPLMSFKIWRKSIKFSCSY